MNEQEAAIQCAAVAAERLMPPEGISLIHYLRDVALQGVRVAEQSGQAAQSLSEVFVCNVDESGGVADVYPLTDPKSNGYHSLHADLWDVYRDGK